jgi:hypothetical protein
MRIPEPGCFRADGGSFFDHITLLSIREGPFSAGREAVYFAWLSSPGAFIGERKNRIIPAFHKLSGGICFPFDGPL